MAFLRWLLSWASIQLGMAAPCKRPFLKWRGPRFVYHMVGRAIQLIWKRPAFGVFSRLDLVPITFSSACFREYYSYATPGTFFASEVVK